MTNEDRLFVSIFFGFIPVYVIFFISVFSGLSPMFGGIGLLTWPLWSIGTWFIAPQIYAWLKKTS